MIILFLITAFLLFWSGIIDPGYMLKGHPNDIRLKNGNQKESSIRIKNNDFSCIFFYILKINRNLLYPLFYEITSFFGKFGKVS